MSHIKHVAIIMDGNGRWAQMRNRPRAYGHIKGVRVAKKIITHCSKIGLKNLTLYAFSSENWFRPEEEIFILMTLLERYLVKETDNLVRENIQFHTIGDLTKLPVDIQNQINLAKKKTTHCTGLKLTFALSYGSRQEIVSAMQSIATDISTGRLQKNDITEELISSRMMTTHTPDPDLIIRTSGESRLSNFLMWQSAYSELYFTNILWPDFKENDFNKALSDFKNRDRRFGRITTTLNQLFKKSNLKNEELNS